MRLTSVLWIGGLVALAACSEGGRRIRDPHPLEPALESSLAAWLEREGKPPEEYVVGLFADHDVVFLGEQHRVRHDVLFVQSLVEPLYRSGVCTLATEFGRREDQPLIDSLITAPAWDEDLAREIVFRQFVWWGYREYVDVYRAAWTLNHTRPEGSPAFRILGVNDSPDWSLIRTPADRDDPRIRRRVWRGGGEDRWAEVILDAARSGEKVLVHMGIHHAFTEYRQPIVVGGEFRHFDRDLRCGNHVYAALGKRAVTVFLHAPWNGPEGFDAPMVHPADGVIDALMLALGPRPVGFGVSTGPFAELRIHDAVYRHGYEDFTLRDFCDGWVYTTPISQYEGVTPIPGWIDDANLARACAQSPNPALRKASADQFNSGIARDAEIHLRWGYLR